MIQTHTEPHSGQRYVTGDTVEELMDFIMPHIRAESQEFYRREIPQDLELVGISLVDRHAAGLLTRLQLREEA